MAGTLVDPKDKRYKNLLDPKIYEYENLLDGDTKIFWIRARPRFFVGRPPQQPPPPTDDLFCGCDHGVRIFAPSAAPACPSGIRFFLSNDDDDYTTGRMGVV